jgi:hypothetical protein
VNAPYESDPPWIFIPPWINDPDFCAFIPLSRIRVALISGAIFGRGLLRALAVGALTTVIGWLVIDGHFRHHVGVLWFFLWPFLLMTELAIVHTVMSVAVTIVRARRQHVPYRTMFEAIAVFHFDQGGPLQKEGFRQMSRADLEKLILQTRRALEPPFSGTNEFFPRHRPL